MQWCRWFVLGLMLQAFCQQAGALANPIDDVIDRAKALAGATFDINVVPDRNPLFEQVSGGGIRNVYTVRIFNKMLSAHKFEIAVNGLKDASLSYAGVEGGEPPVEVKPDDVRAVKVYVTVPGEEAAKLPSSTVFTFSVRDTADGTEATRKTNFRAPGPR